MPQKHDEFTTAYIACALWSSTDEHGRPLDDRTDIELSAVTESAMVADCAKFQAEQDWTEGTLEQAGHDFWLTRNGHGAGFWDGDWPITGDTLRAASKAYGEFNLYVGDDGYIYHN